MKCHFDDNIECTADECFAECPHHPYRDLLEENEQMKEAQTPKKLKVPKSKETNVEGLFFKAIRVVFVTIVVSFIPVLFLIVISGAILEAVSES